MRIRHKVNVVASEDTDGRNKLFAPDDALCEVVIDGMQEFQSGTTTVPASSTYTVPFGDVDVRGLFLRVNCDVVINLNNGDPIHLSRGATGQGTVVSSARMMVEAVLTEAMVTTDTTPVVVQWCFWGNPL